MTAETEPLPAPADAALQPGSGRRGRARWVVLGVALVVLAIAGAVGYRLARGDQSLGEVKLKPYPAPDFALTLFDGSRFSLASQRGNVVVLNFWASWCDPCRAEAPVLESSWQRYRSRGVVFVGVDIKDTPEDARGFLQRYTASYANGFDAEKKIYIDYGVYGLPETFVIGRDGQVLHHVIGAVTGPQLDGWLAPLLQR